MDVTMAVLADYANVSREGKLNVMGIFDRLVARPIPGQFPPMQLVIRLDAHYAELGEEHALRVQIAGPDGEALFDINGTFTPRGGGEPGRPVSVNHILRLGSLPLRAAGGHQVLIWIDNDLKKELPLQVDEAPSIPGPATGGPGEDPPVH